MSNVKDVKSKDVKITLSDGVERTLKYDLNALAELEDRYGTVDKAFEALDSNSIKAIRCMLWAGLIHAESELTERQVGSLIDMSQLKDIMESVTEAFGQDMPTEQSNEQVVQASVVANPN